MNTSVPATSSPHANGVTGFRIDRTHNAEQPTPAADTTSEQAVAAPVTPRSHPPLPKRNKGQLFLAVIFLGFFCTIFYSVYATFFQFKAYGVVSGRLIKVSAPWDGTVLSWQVREGDIVQQDQVVAVISNLEMEHRLQTLDDELRYAQAKVDAEASKIRFNYSDKSDRDQKALAEFLEAQGNLLSEQAEFRELQQKLKRAKRLLQSGNVSRQSYEELAHRSLGQSQKVQKLQKAVEALRERSEKSSLMENSPQNQLDPLLVKIEQIQAERERLRARIDLGRIVAPISGRVTLRTLLTGEAIQQGEPIIEILEDNSTEAILYVPQNHTDELHLNKQILVTLEPFDREIPCVVTRIDNQFLPAPGSIERFYQKNQHLLPVHLAPLPEFRDEFRKRINGTVKLPYSLKEWVSDLWVSIKSKFASETDQENRAGNDTQSSKTSNHDLQLLESGEVEDE